MSNVINLEEYKNKKEKSIENIYDYDDKQEDIEVE